MKKIIVVIISIVFTACTDFLNVSDELAGQLTLEEVFSNPSYTRRFHRYIYTGIPDMKMMVFNTNYSSTSLTGLQNPWPALSDELKASRNSVESVPTAGYHSGSAKYSRWSLYAQIRQCNIFMENAKTIDGDVDKITQDELKDLMAQARFFRAYYHYLLFELYGPIPIMKDIIDPESKDLDFQRNTLDEVVNYINSELLSVSNELPMERNSDNERVMPTKGLALALRAKLLIYAASPLFNGEYKEAQALKNNDGTSLFPQKDDTKWTTALNAMQDFIDLAESGIYKLHIAYNNDGSINPVKSVHEVQQIYNKEIIWATSHSSLNGVGSDGQDWSVTPRTEGNGQTALGVLQEMVDDFFVKDGLSIEESPIYTEQGFGEYKNEIPTNPIMGGIQPVIYTEVSNMYLNREPRFYDAIFFQGRRWQISGNAIFFHDGGNNGKTGGMYSRTGYLPHKGYSKEIYNLGNFKRYQFRPSILFRLAEFYLLYAEVLNEVNPADSRIIEYVDRVRERAGIPKLADIKPEILGDKDLQEAAIRKEMRVELFMEGQRYFNVRRWMIAEENQQGPQGGWMHKMNIDSSDPKEGFHTREKLENRIFERRMYLYPIPLNQIQKSKKLVQNPGW